MSPENWITLIVGTAGILTAVGKFALEFTRPSRLFREIKRLGEARDLLPAGSKSRSNLTALAEASADELGRISRKRIRGGIFSNSLTDWLLLAFNIFLLLMVFGAPYILHLDGMDSQAPWAAGFFFVAFLAFSGAMDKRLRPRGELVDKMDAWFEAKIEDVFKLEDDAVTTDKRQAQGQ